MRRGGEWSWKWYAINAVGWLTFLWLLIEIGNFYEIEFFTGLKKLGWHGIVAMAVLSLMLAPATYFIVKIANKTIRYQLENLARNEQKVSKYCRLVQDKKKFDEHQERLVAEANEVLFATGSRSRNTAYLARIEKRVMEVTALRYTRILFGPIRRDELRQHCTTLIGNISVSSRIKICEVSDLNNNTEAFYIVNEKEALIVVPSINASGNFDTGLLLTGPLHRRVRSVVESYSRNAAPWVP